VAHGDASAGGDDARDCLVALGFSPASLAAPKGSATSDSALFNLQSSISNRQFPVRCPPAPSPCRLAARSADG
jgi:hypothetical protein